MNQQEFEHATEAVSTLTGFLIGVATRAAVRDGVDTYEVATAMLTAAVALLEMNTDKTEAARLLRVAADELGDSNPAN